VHGTPPSSRPGGPGVGRQAPAGGRRVDRSK
jgi:hypothetical protein